MEIGDQFSAWEQDGRVDIGPDEMVDWLAEQSPDTWHKIAMSWQYDYEATPLLWIAHQPACDFGTACQLFGTEAHNWMTTPSWEDLGSESYQTSWKMCDKVAERWHANDFATAELKHAADVLNTYKIMEPRHKDAGQSITWDVPAHVYDYTGSREAKSEYTSYDGAIYYDFEYWRTSRGYT